MRTVALLTLLLVASPPLVAQVPRLLRDVNAVGYQNPGSLPLFFTRAGGLVFFSARTGATGRELFQTAGIPAATKLVADIRPGPSDSNPLGLTSFAGGLLFFASQNQARYLYHYDPATSTLTSLAATPPARGDWVVTIGSIAFFSGRTGADDELWATDGTPGGTRLVADINPTGPSTPTPLGVHAGIFYFGATTPQAGTEIWRSDGTAAGTWMLADTVPGTGSGMPEHFASLGNTFVFGLDITFNDRVWVSDGTTANTREIAAFPVNSSRGLGPFTPFGGRVFFGAETSAAGRELWVTDGNVASMVIDAVPGSGGLEPFTITVLGNSLLFTGKTPANGYELWRSDGTAAGTAMLVDIEPGSVSSSPRDLTAVGGVAYFQAGRSTEGTELWQTDGTAAGTSLVRDIEPGPASSNPGALTSIGGALWFHATTVQWGDEPYYLDATGLRLVADVQPAAVGSAASRPSQLVDLAGTVFFAADDGVTGDELWLTDGTTPGTRLVLDIEPGRGGSRPTELTVFGNRLFFAATSSSNDRELWVSDGTIPGTRELIDLHAGSFNPKALTVAADKLFFTGIVGTGQQARIGIFRSDGTANGTTLLTTVDLGSGQVSPRALTGIGDRLFFCSNDVVTGWEPWTSDGTSVGTRRLADLNPGSGDASPTEFVGYRGHCYFPATDGQSDTELYRSDGTTIGTARFADLDPGGSSSPRALTVANDLLFFVADVQGVPRLFRSDGTAAGTRLVTTAIAPLPNDPLEPFADGVLFVGSDIHPWRSDGTVKGTYRLTTTVRPSKTVTPRHFFGNGARSIWFAGHDGVDNELWFTDGSRAGTRRVADINPGPTSSLPGEIVMSGGRVVFSADGGPEQREPWVLEPAGFAHPTGSGRGDGLRTPTLRASEPKVGKPFELRGFDATPNAQGFVLASPYLIPAIPLGAGSFGYVSPVSFAVLSRFVPAAAAWSWKFTIPNDPALIGATAALQAYFAPTAAPLGIDFTNAVHARIGR